MRENVLIVAIAVAFLFCLLGIVFSMVAKYGNKKEERKGIYKVYSWVFFYIAIGIIIGVVSVYFVLNYNGSLN